jgi:hypothetical protein
VQDLVLQGRVSAIAASAGRHRMASGCWRPCSRCRWTYFGPELRRFLLAQHRRRQMTVEWLTTQRRGSPWMTPARGTPANGFCTQIGNDDFTWFGTGASKRRLNFLDLLGASHTVYVANGAAVHYMRSRSLAGLVISRLTSAPQNRFADHGLADDVRVRYLAKCRAEIFPPGCFPSCRLSDRSPISRVSSAGRPRCARRGQKPCRPDHRLS